RRVAMTSKRMLLASMTIVATTLWAVISFAADRIPFDQKAFEAAQAAGKSILVDVSAPWCPICRAQKPIIEKLSLLPEYKDLQIFDVDFDTQKAVLRSLQVQQQSTLIVFRGAKEIDRSVGSTDPSAISDLLKKAL
ncbi:MAG: thioredoxin family protein, partial [Methyloceanibacter sp.]